MQMRLHEEQGYMYMEYISVNSSNPSHTRTTVVANETLELQQALSKNTKIDYHHLNLMEKHSRRWCTCNRRAERVYIYTTIMVV